MGDQLFDSNETSEETTEEEAKPTAPKESNVANQIAEALEKGFGKHSSDLQQFGQQVSQAIQQVQATPQDPAIDPVQQATELAQQLLEDPKTVIGNEVKPLVMDILREQLGPYFQTQIDDTYDSLMAEHTKEVDTRFGEGTFTDVIQPQLEAILGQMGPAEKANAKVFRSTIDTIKGKDEVADKLYELKAALARKAKGEVGGPPMMLSNTGRLMPKDQLSERDRDFINQHDDKTGTVLDAKRLLEVRKARDEGGWTLKNFPISKEAN